MHLKDEGFKFCINPEKTQGRWMNPTEFRVLHPNWTDVTEWPEGLLIAYLMPVPEQQELFAA